MDGVLDVQHVPFFKNAYLIKYGTIWDNSLMEKLNSGESLLFCDASPEFCVQVDNFAVNNDVKDPSELTVFFSDYSFEGIKEEILKKQNEIVEISRSQKDTFVLDVKSMKVINRESFRFGAPIRGLSTLFIYRNENDLVFRTIVNPTRYSMEDMFGIFLGMLYCSNSALPPLDNRVEEEYGKQLAITISRFCFEGRKAFYPPVNTEMLRPITLPHLRITTLRSKRKIDRLLTLIESSVSERDKINEKKKRMQRS